MGFPTWIMYISASSLGGHWSDVNQKVSSWLPRSLSSKVGGSGVMRMDMWVDITHHINLGVEHTTQITSIPILCGLEIVQSVLYDAVHIFMIHIY